MSWVNNAVVFYGTGNSSKHMGQVNAYLLEHDHREQRFRMDTSHIPWYGGTKFMEGDVWGAAFNHVSFDTVMAALQSADWTYPDTVILVWKGETDYNWNVYKLGDEEIVDEGYWR